jgi:colanic acid/amylovoran biosynthesis protein
MEDLLIIQNYNANKGDSSVIHTMKKTILEMDKDIKISLTSYDPIAAKDEYGIDSAEWIINFKNIKLANSKSAKLYYFSKEFLWIIYSLIWILFYKLNFKLPLPQNKKETISLYLKSEVVVLPGGHFFTNLNGFPVNISHAYGLLYAKWLGKKTMIYSQTVGPFFGKFGAITRAVADYVIKHTDIVTLREKDSTQYCKGYKNVHVTAETVFALPTNKEVAKELSQLVELKNEKKLIVGVTIHHIYFKHFFAKEDYVSLMSNIFDEISSNYNCNILIIPMEASYHKGGDRPIANEMKHMSKNSQKIHILDGDLDPLMTSSAIANTDIFIGTKTHSIVYGLKSMIPTISISYQQKSTEFMKMFHVEENAIDLKGLNLENFMTVFKRVYDNKEKYMHIQEESYAQIKKKSLQNNEFLASLFCEVNDGK